MISTDIELKKQKEFSSDAAVGIETEFEISVRFGMTSVRV